MVTVVGAAGSFLEAEKTLLEEKESSMSSELLLSLDIMELGLGKRVLFVCEKSVLFFLSLVLLKLLSEIEAWLESLFSGLENV